VRLKTVPLSLLSQAGAGGVPSRGSGQPVCDERGYGCCGVPADDAVELNVSQVRLRRQTAHCVGTLRTMFDCHISNFHLKGLLIVNMDVYISK
jgi:hypothetical protein